MVLTHQWAVPSYWFGNSTHDHTGRRKKNMKGPAKRVKVSSRVYKVTFKFHSYPPLSNHLHFSHLKYFHVIFKLVKGKIGPISQVSTKELSLICLSALFFTILTWQRSVTNSAGAVIEFNVSGISSVNLVLLNLTKSWS